MSNPFFDHPISNSPYEYPRRHWELDDAGATHPEYFREPTQCQIHHADPKPKKHKAAAQTVLVFDEGKGLSTKEQQYDPTSIINEVRGYEDAWRQLSPGQWQVSPETRRLLEHWRQHQFSGVRVEVTRTWCSCKRRAACLVLPTAEGARKGFGLGRRPDAKASNFF